MADEQTPNEIEPKLGPFAPRKLREIDRLAADLDQLHQLAESKRTTFVDRRLVSVSRGELQEIAMDVIGTVLEKNADYGDAWQRQGINGVLVRLADKLYRIDNLAGREALVASETVEDTLRDAIGYSLLGLLYLRHRREEADVQLNWEKHRAGMLTRDEFIRLHMGTFPPIEEEEPEHGAAKTTTVGGYKFKWNYCRIHHAWEPEWATEE